MDANTEAEVSSLAAKLVELEHMLTISSEECVESSALEEEIDSVKKQLWFLITPFVADGTTVRKFFWNLLGYHGAESCDFKSEKRWK